MNKRDKLSVVYLAGTSYCGSTLMAFLMNSHPKIVSTGETSPNRALQIKGSEEDYCCSCGQIMLRCSFWQKIFQMVSKQGFPFNTQKWSNDYRYKNVYLNKLIGRYSSHQSIRYLQRAADLIIPIHSTRVQKANQINRIFIQTILELEKADVYFDASKGLLRLYHLHRQPCLEVKIIRMIRDVRAFANSAKRKGRLINDAAEHWVKYHKSLEQFVSKLSGQQVFTLKYEDLCQNPTYWLQKIYKFIGVEVLPIPDFIKSEEHHIIGNKRTCAQKHLKVYFKESWKEKLSDSEISLTMRIAGDVNECFGYA